MGRNKKQTMKRILDGFMTIVLLFLMARQITGDAVHEWLGVGIMVLWIAHHFLDRNWYGHMFQGKYTSVRIIQMVLNTALFLSMLGLMVSGIILSREVFAFLPISGGIALARTLHLLSAYWGFVLVSLHLGLYWNRVLGIVRKSAKLSGPIYKWVSRTAATVIAGYGIYAFAKRDIGSYMLLQSQFVFFDFEEPILLFFADYAAIMAMFVYVGHYLQLLLRRGKRNRG